MVYEVIIQQVAAEKREEYIKVFGEFLTKANYAGSHSIRFLTSIENPSRVILMVKWDSVDAHTQIRGTPTYNAMRELTSQYQTAKSDGAHFLMHEVKR